MKMLNTIVAIRRELAWAHKSLTSRLIPFGIDALAFRALRVLPRLPTRDLERSLEIRGGPQIIYRRNRGDLQSIREVFMDRVYRLPEHLRPQTLVDLGGNIGLSTLWFTHQYPSITKAVVVEPFAPNAALITRNLATNNVVAEVITAAAAPWSGTASFVASDSSNMGHLGDGAGSTTVPTITLGEILAKTNGSIDILKIDIEGGEHALLTGDDVSWLGAVGCIIAEFHPPFSDYQRLTEIIIEHGFSYHPPGSLWSGSGDIFIKNAL
jgi:FkbM family methyltransferase